MGFIILLFNVEQIGLEISRILPFVSQFLFTFCERFDTLTCSVISYNFKLLGL